MITKWLMPSHVAFLLITVALCGCSGGEQNNGLDLERWYSSRAY
jgi:hypothetical protein